MFIGTDFTDADGTLLEDHTPTIVGTGFSRHPSYPTGFFVINNGEVRGGGEVGSTVPTLYFSDDAPSSADYSVESVMVSPSESNSYWTLCARVVLTAGYLLGYDNGWFSELTEFFLDEFKIYLTDPGW